MTVGIPIEGLDLDAPYRLFAAPLGRLIFAFSYLEKDLNWCVAALAGVHPMGSAADTMLGKLSSFGHRIENVGKNIRQRRGECELWTPLEARMRALSEFRNFAAHGLWAAYSLTAWDVGEPAWQVQKVDLKTKRLTFRTISVTDLQGAALEAQRLSVDLLKYVQPIVAPDLVSRLGGIR